MTFSDIGELVVLILVCISIPGIYAISKLNKGESLGDPKLPIVWPIIVAAAYAYYVHSIDPYWSVTPFIGAAFIGVLANAGLYSLIENRIKEKEYAKEQMNRKEEEIKQLRKEINEMQDKGKDI